MNYGEMMARVRERADCDRDEARMLTAAVMSALSRRLAPASARHLADQLPEEFADYLEDAEAPARNWGVHEFVRQVAQATGRTEEAAEEGAGAVLSVLAEEVSGGELNKLISQLPSGFARLFGKPELA